TRSPFPRPEESSINQSLKRINRTCYHLEGCSHTDGSVFARHGIREGHHSHTWFRGNHEKAQLAARVAAVRTPCSAVRAGAQQAHSIGNDDHFARWLDPAV